MRWSNSLSPESFLEKYWQKQTLFLPGAADADLPSLDANELAWLATLPDVESRLVFTERTDSKTGYRVEQGPFREDDLKALPAEDWTLLVQDVDKHLPAFREYFGQVPFIPSWRIDDLMVSFAAPGGSVGPHKDNYDVFLCQGKGSRNWLVSDDRSAPADPSIRSLSLLKPFEPTQERLCNVGDVLYVPPGIPHWGIAKEFCTTYSIGMRAPTRAELATGYARVYSPGSDAPTVEDDRSSLTFYADSDLQPGEADNGQISVASARRAKEQKLLDEARSDEELMLVLGSVVTDPKAWLDPDQPSAGDVEAVLQGRRELRVHGMALITWCESDDFRFVFVNGSARRIPASATGLVRALCVDRVAHRDAILALAAHREGLEFISWLLDHGLLDIE